MYSLLVLLLLAGSLYADAVRETDGYRLTAHTETEQGILVTFDLLDYTLLQGRDYDHLQIEGAGSRSHRGAPDLPLISTLLEVPSAAGIGLELLEQGGRSRLSFTPQPINDRSERLQPGATPTIPKDVSQLTADQLPLSNLGTAGILRDRRVVQLTFSPCRYLPERSELEIYTHVEVLISFRGDDFSNSEPVVVRPLSEAWQELYHNLILNNSTAARDENPPYGDYIVCYPEGAYDALQPLIQWKRELGYGVDTLCADTNHLDHVDLKNYLQDRWDSGDSFDYLLLVGDKDYYADALQMDAWFIEGGAYAEPEWGGQIVTDHPYSMLAGDDYLPDVLVGRLSVDNVPQLQTVVSKILLYERDIDPDPDNPQWQQRALMVCDRALAWSRVDVMRQIRNDMLADGFVEVDSAYSHYYNPLPISTIYNKVNDGLSFVNYRGYGMRNAWYTPYFTSYDITSTLHNYHQLPVVTGIVCGGGDFASVDHDPNFGETWLRHGSSTQPRGAVAFIGPSEEDTHTRWNNTIDLGIYLGLLQEDLPRLGQLLTRGKLELYLNNPDFHDPGQPDNSVHFYFHTYNLLGDPGLLLTAGRPAELSVSHAAMAPLGSSEVVVEVTSAGQPAEAFVTLYDAAADAAYSAWSDQSGLALIPVEFSSATTLQLTASGQGWIPARSVMTVSDAALLQPVELVVEGGGELVMGEPLTVQLSVSNQGGEATDPCVVILQSEGCSFAGMVSVPTVAPGGEALSTAVGLEITDPGLVLEQHSFFGQIDGGDRLGFRQLIHGRALTVGGLLFQDGDNQLPERGETASFEIELTATGDRSFPTGTIINTVFPAGLQGSPQDFQLAAELLPGETTVLNTSLTVASACLYGTRPLSLSAVHAGYTYTAPGWLTVGELTWIEPGGPDEYGYRVYHSQDSFTPVQFEWLELDPSQGGPGSRLYIQDSYWGDDDAPHGETETVHLSAAAPFNFVFYGQNCDTISIASNGWITPGVSNLTSFRNTQIPGANGPPGMIAPLWDDLHNSDGGDIYTWHDQEAGKYYIEWEEFYLVNATQQPLNFQVVLHDAERYPTGSGDSEIIFHYLNFRNGNSWENYATIGIENHTETVGLEYSFNNDFILPNQQLANGHSLCFTTGSTLNAPVLELLIFDDYLYLYWDLVPGATDYHVYSSTDPYSDFTIDESGVMYDGVWTVPLPAGQRYYRVTAER